LSAAVAGGRPRATGFSSSALILLKNTLKLRGAELKRKMEPVTRRALTLLKL
jgi:hypothetical protein